MYLKKPTDDKIEMALEWFQTIPLVSGDQIAKLFDGYRSPEKRASEVLRFLKEEGLIECKERELGKSKLWRFTKKGKEQFNITSRSIPFLTKHTEHTLRIGDVWHYLRFRMNGLDYFQFELREEFTKSDGTIMKYCPDAHFRLEGEDFLLELQRTRLSFDRWGKKWSVGEAYFSGGHHRSKFEKVPKILVLTSSSPKIVKSNSWLPLIIAPTMDDFKKEISLVKSTL